MKYPFSGAGALAHCLQCQTTCKIQNDRQGLAPSHIKIKPKQDLGLKCSAWKRLESWLCFWKKGGLLSEGSGH